jgi:hypothetical protein
MPLGDYLEFDEPQFRREKQSETIDTLLYVHKELTESNKNAIAALGGSIVTAFFTFGAGVVGYLASARVLAVNNKKREIIQAILRGRGCVFSVPGDDQHLVLASRPDEVRL